MSRKSIVDLFLIIFLLGCNSQNEGESGTHEECTNLYNRETNAINNANKSSCGRKTISLKEILTIYANLTKRIVLIGPQIPLITVEYAPEEMLSRDDAAKYIAATLFEHGIVVEAFGSKYVKVLRKEGLRSGSLRESIKIEIIKPSEQETE